MAVSCPARPVAVKLDRDLSDRLKRLAEARQRTSHWLMKQAVLEYVDREEKRESFRQEALKAWSAYQADGLYVAFEEADAWLARLEGGDDAPLPLCRG